MYSELSPEILIPKIVNTAEKIKKYALFEKPKARIIRKEKTNGKKERIGMPII